MERWTYDSHNVVLYKSGENLRFDITQFRQAVISFMEIQFFHVFVL